MVNINRFTFGPGPRRPRTRRRPTRRWGLSLPEVMISLAISTSLLVAVGGAFNASAAAVEQNDRFFRASQAARVTMNQMLTEIRRCDAVEVGTNYIKVIRPIEDLDPGEVYRKFAFDAANRRLTVQKFGAGDVGGTIYTLASNVESATFGPAELRQAANETWVVTRVPVTIRTKIVGNDVTLNGSAGPRRAQAE